MDCSTLGFPVLHYLLEFPQTHVYQISDAIQQSHPLSPLFPPAFNLSQHQGHSQWDKSRRSHWPERRMEHRGDGERDPRLGQWRLQMPRLLLAPGLFHGDTPVPHLWTFWDIFLPCLYPNALPFISPEAFALMSSFQSRPRWLLLLRPRQCMPNLSFFKEPWEGQFKWLFLQAVPQKLHSAPLCLSIVFPEDLVWERTELRGPCTAGLLSLTPKELPPSSLQSDPAQGNLKSWTNLFFPQIRQLLSQWYYQGIHSSLASNGCSATLLWGGFDLVFSLW